MKTRLNWFKASAGLALALGANSLMAQSKDDSPRSTQKTEVIVVHGSKDAEDISDVLAKVSKELDKANVSEEIKAKILKQLESATSKADAAIKEATKGAIRTRAIVGAAKSEDGKAPQEVQVTVIHGDDDNAQGTPKVVQGVPLPRIAQGARVIQGVPLAVEQFRTRLIRPTGKDGENYRIGIKCQQTSEVVDGDDAKDDKPKLGLRIEIVLEDSPAEKAGIKKGDLILTANAKEIKGFADLMELVQEAGKNEKTLTLELKRDDKTIKIDLQPIKMKPADVEMENIELSLPAGGFVLNEEAMKKFQDQVEKWKPENMTKGFAFAMPTPGDSSEWKKEIDEIKSEISEIKKMLQGLIDKK
ncbi:MAG: PDZ domain-containing protein [Planctomycetota bacterium]|nr:PDZ domain-containing protein [Planctomycetota bacterium]